ncbi:MAG: 30S ribosomal protein S13 [Microgenomates group bacterium GW2011_GWC1_38_14]|nr:MAG: 30S ribosomal protein S13 [Candidatus Levybacteria bacterium GW2011_GWA2_36_13]KKQ00812.1 MAG: 30S ribosomal protein S13 [Candidatus Levybacteria bacterium GW2011_GWB1_36_18]KKQ58317.1 MAG: 30S ribosomal protein S13 [Microgenomates group bacterium GW2011_GWC1_38_14]KKR15910.1 MAG: 30S ribosomal protein S13 [Candidatus Levybacteria bacterium GW2011_GWA1_39_32]OGH43852.1 MAG: 30S ribosomal protein S13 [Candidatus Levybacteria bacterium RIFCSPLOWO2_02_FULL_37_11]
MRVSGVNIPDNKKLEIALTYLYGVGRKNVVEILKKSQVDGSKRVNEVSEEELKKIQKSLEKLKLEGDLRAEITENIKRLREIGSYRGVRHSKNLPVRGQRTRSNARTKRGKRVTIGAIKKEVAVKMGLTTETEK